MIHKRSSLRFTFYVLDKVSEHFTVLGGGNVGGSPPTPPFSPNCKGQKNLVLRIYLRLVHRSAGSGLAIGLLDLAPGALGLSCVGGGHGGGVIARPLVGAGERSDRPRRREHRAGRGLVLARSLRRCAWPLMRLAGQQEPDVAAPDAVDRALAVEARERGAQPLGLSEGIAQPGEQVAQVGGQVVPTPERLALLVAAGGAPGATAHQQI